MKNAIVLALVSLASVNAFAAPKSARITHMNIDPNAFGKVKYTDGSISIDPNSRQATLSLYRINPCLPGRVCAQMVIAPMNVTLQIVSRQTTSCHAVIYTAMSDQRMVDGLRQTLTITDNEKNNCRTMQALAPVSAQYETSGRTMKGSVETLSTFIAEPFVSAVN